MELLVLHEWGHSYVNASVNAALQSLTWDQKSALWEASSRAASHLSQYDYGTGVYGFLYEQVLRAVCCLAAKNLYGYGTYLSEVSQNQKMGFGLTQFMVKQLEYYREHRDQYPTLDSFMPELLRRVSSSDKLPWTTMDPHTPIFLTLALIVAAGVAAKVWGLRLWRRYRAGRSQ